MSYVVTACGGRWLLEFVIAVESTCKQSSKEVGWLRLER